MAYIDVENDSAKYRVVAGPHTRTAPGKLMPEDCSAVMIEFAENDIADPVSTLANLFGHIQYHELAHESYERGIPVVSAEPMYTQPGLEWVSWVNEKLINSEALGMLELWAFNLIGERDKSVKYRGFGYRLLERLRNKELAVLSVSDSTAFSTLRDTMMAERAYRLAYSLSDPESALHHFISPPPSKKPCVTLSVGTFHFGIAEKLQMNSEDRRQLLTDNIRTLIQMFYPDNLFKIHFAVPMPDSKERLVQVYAVEV